MHNIGMKYPTRTFSHPDFLPASIFFSLQHSSERLKTIATILDRDAQPSKRRGRLSLEGGNYPVL
jgi:hypothetical protein